MTQKGKPGDPSIIDIQVIPVCIAAGTGGLIGELVPQRGDDEGIPFVRLIGPGLVPVDEGDDSDDIAVSVDSRIPATARLYGFDGATFDRIRSGATNSDSIAVLTLGALMTLDHNLVFNNDAGTWGRIQSDDDNNPTAEANVQSVASRGRLFNRSGSEYEFDESNENRSIFASAARTATATSTTQLNTSRRGAHVIIDVTAITDTPSVVPHIEASWDGGATFYDLLVGAPITATGTTVLKVYPGLTPIPNSVSNDILPYQWRVRMVHADVDSITYSVRANIQK